MQENTKSVAVKMTARRCFRTEPIWQYDVGHVLTFEGFELPTAFEVHFSRSPMGKAVTQIGTDGACTVPDMFAQSAGVIYAWLYIAEDDTGLTKFSIEIPVQKRAQITNQEPTPVEQSAIDQAIAALNDGVERSETAADAAESAQEAAEGYAESAGQSAITATNAASAAASAKTAAETAARNAATSATDAHTSREAADQSATNAGVSERNARSSAQAAAGSASAAAQSATNASGSASAAAGSASTASTKAGEAASSATAAAGSAATAGTKAGEAASSASAAAQKAQEAASSAGSASQSATDANTAKTAAETAKTDALSAKADAQTAATNAAGSASSASGSASAAAQSATAAAQSATEAAQSAQALASLIDDTAGVGDTTKVWSADKSATEQNSLLSALNGKADVIVNTASGDIASFDDGADGMPIKAMTVQIEPVQEGSGDPSPDNVRPITGHTAVTVTRTGKNLLVKDVVYYQNAPDTLDGCFFLKAGTYILSVESFANATSWRYGIRLKDASGNNLTADKYRPSTWMNWNVNSLMWLGGSNGTDKTLPITLVEDCYIRILVAVGDTSASTVVNGAMLVEGSTATAYEPYSGQTYSITLPSEAGTVYGGTLDPVAGVVRADRAMVDLGSLNWSYNANWGGAGAFYCNTAPAGIKTDNPTTVVPNAMCTTYATYARDYLYNNPGVTGFCIPNNTAQVSIRDSRYTDAASFKTAMSGVMLVYELAEPQTIQLDPVTLTTLLGSNRIWADCGAVSVDYCADTKTYVDSNEGVKDVQVNGVSVVTDGVANVPVHSIPSGGSSGQVLAKTSGTNYAVAWVDANPVQTVSGTTPSITALPGVRYVCGEVATLDITVPASGIIDVVFESGSTATVLTVTPPTGMTMKWIGEDPTALEANKSYEINIMDGCRGMVVSWT